MNAQVVDWLTLVLAVAAAWSMGHHYSGAVVGPAFGSKAVAMYLGIALAGVFVVLGSLATNVVSTYASLADVSGAYNLAALSSLVLMANLTTYLKVPTSTIQLYAFSLLGAAVATGAAVDYRLFLLLGVGWVLSPAASYLLARPVHKAIPSGSRHLRLLIVCIMLYSAFVLGLNDVSNAASSLVLAGFGSVFARVVCGVGMYAGMLAWGPRLIRRVGEELVAMDPAKAVASQLTKSVVVSTLNVFGLNASMNQAIVAALAALGARREVLRSIFLGWVYSPLVGFATAYALAVLIAHA